LLQCPLEFPRKMYAFLVTMKKQMECAMTSSLDLEQCLKSLEQIVSDLDREHAFGLERVKLHRVEALFDYSIDLRQRGRSLLISECATKRTTSSKQLVHLHLFSDILLCSNKKLGRNRFTLQQHLSLDALSMNDGDVMECKRKYKKMESRTITVTVDSNQDVFVLIFESEQKKSTWYQLLRRLVAEHKGGIDCVSESAFCGVCHCEFNALFNARLKCTRCALSMCRACCFVETERLCIRCYLHDQHERNCNAQRI